MFSIPGIMKMLQAVGPIAARASEFKDVFDQIVSTFKKPADQDTLKRAYSEIMAENTGGHTRLQEMLRVASLEDEATGHATDLGGNKTPGF